MPILVGMLLVGFLLFVINSVKIVSEKNKNNFAYTVKVRDTSKEIDKIVERAEVNVNTIHNIIKETYDASYKTADFDMITKLQTKIETVTGIKSVSQNATAFVDTVLKDYNYYTQNM